MKSNVLPRSLTGYQLCIGGPTGSVSLCITYYSLMGVVIIIIIIIIVYYAEAAVQ